MLAKPSRRGTRCSARYLRRATMVARPNVGSSARSAWRSFDGDCSERQRVSMAFGGLNVVSDLDLHVDEGEIVSAIGPNGAGKTTLFNLITGVYELIHGDIVFASESIVGLEPHRITRKGIARTFQTLRLFLNMTVWRT